MSTSNSSVVRLTLLYINFEAVIPAKAGIQLGKTGFRVKPGMTINGKGFMTHYTMSAPKTPLPILLRFDSRTRANLQRPRAQITPVDRVPISATMKTSGNTQRR